MQADCICIEYLCVPVCVIEGGGGSSTPSLKSTTPVFTKVDCVKKDVTALAFKLNHLVLYAKF